MGSIQTLNPQPSPYSETPPGWSSAPAPGKLQSLWAYNSKNIYHRNSPTSEYGDNNLIGGFTQQPYYYIYPDQNNSFPNSQLKYDTRTVPLASSIIDIQRVSKFLVSGNGILFLAKQFLLQTGNVYNETRIYNPTSPIVAAAKGISLGSLAPQRNFDTSAGLAGLVGSLLGSSIQSTLFGAPKINPPAGTTGINALPLVNQTTGGKGLLRAQTANNGLAHLKAAWGQPSNSPGFLASMFANFIPAKQKGITYKSDEGTYGIMLADKKAMLSYIDRNDSPVDFSQLWVAGGKTIRKNGEYPVDATRFFVDINGNSVNISVKNLNKGIQIPLVGKVGYAINESKNSAHPGFRYGDNVGSNIDDQYKASDIMYQFGLYSDTQKQYPTKQITPSEVDNYTTMLGKVLSDINNADDGNVYDVNISNVNSRVISNPANSSPLTNGYNRLFNTKNKNDNNSGINYKLGMLQDYRQNNVTTVDDGISTTLYNSLRLPTAGRFDAINTLTVLDGTQMDQVLPNNKGWENTAWKPYQHDLIAFYFHDIVNDKYIPFRATVKGLVESGNATWDELSFLGRADKIYSYTGFNRTAQFSLRVVIGSIAEFAPTWQRINYMASAIKPANYTKATSKVVGLTENRFMVPPMFMMTIGDLYKEQPTIIQSITTTIPEDGAWETISEEGYGGKNWDYLASYISAPNVLFGQLPREVELGFSVILLEKERPIIGGANFGHAPRTDDYSMWNTTTGNSNAPTQLNALTNMNKSMVVNVVNPGINLDSNTETNAANNGQS